MATSVKKSDPSPATREQALKIARGTQRPGQTKEQTRLIAQGIQKGIDQHKKQQKAKARELDKKLKKVSSQAEACQPTTAVETKKIVKYRQHWLPWVLLITSWGAMGAYVFLR